MKPNETNYNPYFKQYINLANEQNLVTQFIESQKAFEQFVQQIPNEKADFKYAENKWTLKQLLIHLIDTERIFTYRALAFCRGEKQNLHSFNEDEYAANSNPENRNLQNILDEFISVRNATIQLFKNLDNLDLQKTGIANGSLLSINAIGHILIGHQVHHFKIITERYL